MEKRQELNLLHKLSFLRADINIINIIFNYYYY